MGKEGVPTFFFTFSWNFQAGNAPKAGHSVHLEIRKAQNDLGGPTESSRALGPVPEGSEFCFENQI